MNQTLEIQNNQIIFNRAAAVFKMQYGSHTEDMIDYLRKLILKSSWKIEAKYFRLNRDNLGLSQSEVADQLNITLSDLRKLEKGVDFMNRDAIARDLKNYLQLQIN
jgi:DNA-binding transcriptional regulator YiaG